MACTIEKVLSDTRMLVSRLKDHDSSADNLIGQATILHKRVDAMKVYQEDLNELNEIARHRPRSALIMNLAQENSQIRELQQENRELRLALEEHQSALELIMSKYREQVVKLVVANRLDRSTSESTSENPMLARDKIDKISEMAAVMQQAIRVDDDTVAQEQEILQQLKMENKTLRELLHITVKSGQFCLNEQTETDTQTDQDECPENKENETTPNNDKNHKDTQNDSNKNSPHIEDSSEMNTDTMKRVEKKKDANKK